LALLTGLEAASAGDVVRFFAIGDVPYSDSEHRLLERLLAQELTEETPFLVHAGDIKAGNQPCTDEAFSGVAALFRSLHTPVVYTPGDNEWTDCRRAAAGRYAPMERLSLLRRVFYGDPGVLRLDRLGVEQSDPVFPENYYFRHQGVVVATVHVVGSRNNLRPRDPAAAAEYEARKAANRHHLQQVAAAAGATDAKALVLIFHANAQLERGQPSPAYEAFHEDLRSLLHSYKGPVLGIHGDTHALRFDRPLTDPDTGRPHARFTRLEVPGSPVVGGAWVTISPGADPPFRVQPAYPRARDALMGQ
jgi:hypothetical protein